MATNRWSWAGIAAVAPLALLLGACAPVERQPVVDGLTVEQAKAASQKWETRIAESVPQADVERVEQREYGRLRSCDTEGAYRWVGITFVHLNRPLSQVEADEVSADLAERLAEDTAGEDGYVVGTSNTSGSLDAEVFGPDGALYRAWIQPETQPEGVAVVNVTSASPCFELPDDVYPGQSF